MLSCTGMCPSAVRELLNLSAHCVLVMSQRALILSPVESHSQVMVSSGSYNLFVPAGGQSSEGFVNSFPELCGDS